MAFPTMNAQAVHATIAGKNVATGTITPIDSGNQLPTATAGYSLFQVPAVVDVSGMEFGVTVLGVAGSGTTHAGIASGVSTVLIRFCDLGTSGSSPASTNYLLGADNTVPVNRVSDFSNTPADGWTTGETKYAVGTTTSDMDAADVIGMQLVHNLTTVAGFGVIGLNVNYVYGKPGAIN